MQFITILVQIINAIPTIVKIVREILDLIASLKQDEQQKAKLDLQGILGKAKAKAAPAPHLAAELSNYLAGLSERARNK